MQQPSVLAPILAVDDCLCTQMLFWVILWMISVRLKFNLPFHHFQQNFTNVLSWQRDLTTLHFTSCARIWSRKISCLPPKRRLKSMDLGWLKWANPTAMSFLLYSSARSWYEVIHIRRRQMFPLPRTFLKIIDFGLAYEFKPDVVRCRGVGYPFEFSACHRVYHNFSQFLIYGKLWSFFQVYHGFYLFTIYIYIFTIIYIVRLEVPGLLCICKLTCQPMTTKAGTPFYVAPQASMGRGGRLHHVGIVGSCPCQVTTVPENRWEIGNFWESRDKRVIPWLLHAGSGRQIWPVSWSVELWRHHVRSDFLGFAASLRIVTVSFLIHILSILSYLCRWKQTFWHSIICLFLIFSDISGDHQIEWGRHTVGSVGLCFGSGALRGLKPPRYVLLCGYPPFWGDTDKKVLQKAGGIRWNREPSIERFHPEILWFTHPFQSLWTVAPWARFPRALLVSIQQIGKTCLGGEETVELTKCDTQNWDQGPGRQETLSLKWQILENTKTLPFSSFLQPFGEISRSFSPLWNRWPEPSKSWLGATKRFRCRCKLSVWNRRTARSCGDFPTFCSPRCGLVGLVDARHGEHRVVTRTRPRVRQVHPRPHQQLRSKRRRPWNETALSKRSDLIIRP